MKFQSGFVSTRFALLSLAAAAMVLLSQWAYAAGKKMGLAEAIEKGKKLSDGTVMSAFYEGRKGGAGVYRLMVLQDGLPGFIELAADTGKQLSVDAKVKGPRKPNMESALKAAEKLVEGEVEGIEFDPETGDYWVEIKLDQGFSAVVLDGESLKIKSMEQRIFHDSKFYKFSGDEDIDIEFFDPKTPWLMLGDLEVEELMMMPEIPKDVRKQMLKEFELSCESKERD
ncbi:hypothetical protein [Pseudoteredinibacter isoporae]|uniref:Putative membrane protein YkoI n=1 Tax=Pseudoteredinibacter isoporae TaxID=570281 RepID=A0A7X0MUS8_9GAMM|nr:hypothetical protein [Pseudoteredinibacter isoporae]MBB6520981.1 putative membrane protein YkoI [Pseudoteredinibacter isoporae]NHO86546.1 hypothetical protein [Pseudoteredinibacter isoporae]NIB25002.1 hypothetical protein [Pseudoteredinibacter isoporae]